MHLSDGVWYIYLGFFIEVILIWLLDKVCWSYRVNSNTDQIPFKYTGIKNKVTNRKSVISEKAIGLLR